MGIIDSAVTWAVSIANDDSHQYSQSARNGPNYDCSSFVSWAYKNAGVDLAISSTASMYTNFVNAGFEAIPYSSSVTLRCGDVLFYHKSGNIGHAIMWLGVIAGSGSTKPQMVEAQGTSAGILVRDADRSGWDTKYQWILRYSGDTPATSAYGYMSETPSIYNSGRRTGTTPGEVVNNVNWHAIDDLGNGYYDTNQYSFTPYIATISPYLTDIRYDNLKAARVSGMMFCAGWMYDDYSRGHAPRKEYIAPHLKEQIEACRKANMSYALYAIVRSKSRIEADKECRSLYYVISQFPPQLGLWLYLDMHNSPHSINEDIVDCYYKYITEWGLSARCGFYTDSSRLTQIEWTKYQNKFYLWMQDYIHDQHSLDKINDKVFSTDFFEVG